MAPPRRKECANRFACGIAASEAAPDSKEWNPFEENGLTKWPAKKENGASLGKGITCLSIFLTAVADGSGRDMAAEFWSRSQENDCFWEPLEFLTFLDFLDFKSAVARWYPFEFRSKGANAAEHDAQKAFR